MSVNDSLRKKIKHYRKSNVKKSNRRKIKRRKTKRNKTKRRQTKRIRIRKNMKGGMEGWAGVSFPDMFSWPSLVSGARALSGVPAPSPAPSPAPPPAPVPAPAAEKPSSNIEESDIMYQDGLVCILKPEVKKGIIIFSYFKQPPSTDSLCDLGFKTGEKLKEEGVEYGAWRIPHPYIFFRAPYYSRDIDYSTTETEINSSYLDPKSSGDASKWSSRVFIRVDPARTFVFSSEIRIKHRDGWLGEQGSANFRKVLNNSKKTLSDYLKIINDNMEIKRDLKPGRKLAYDLYTSKARLVPMARPVEFPLDNSDINLNSEILVSIPHLTPGYFVECNP